jgi:hypothetical protein
MKNIHILPASSPSRLIKDIWKNTFSLVENFNTNHIDFKAQHLYITSDEEIKEGDWCIYINTNQIFQVDSYTISNHIHIDANLKKIILTTDQDLDGVQTIKDDFLEWFVKNPSCEEVEVEKWFDTSHIDLGYGSKVYHNNPNMPLYKIIIPKEEPKQKETLEEVADRLNFIGRELYALKLGAKLQQERSYSEEEVLDIITKWEQQSSWKEFPEEWFEQFKKK